VKKNLPNTPIINNLPSNHFASTRNAQQGQAIPLDRRLVREVLRNASCRHCQRERVLANNGQPRLYQHSHASAGLVAREAPLWKSGKGKNQRCVMPFK
jgi:hypothetical protein